MLRKFEARIAPSNERRLTNVVEDNNNLRQELKDAMSEINRLEKENNLLQTKLKRLDTPFEEINLQTE